MALAITLESLGRFDDANDAFRKVLALQPDSIAAHKRLGAVLRKMHRLDEARKVYEEWLELSPEDPEALHFRSVCSPDDVPGKASESYIKRSFDGFADEFDECLTGLNYQVPELFRGLLESHFGNSIIGSGQLADLGCGTGLCAPHLRDRAERLVGIDLSSGMLAKAREREHYDELIEADIVEHLVGLRDTYDLLVAGDALIFFGDLRPVFKAAVQALREGGHFLFSVEQLNQDQADRDFGLSWSGRYQHSAAAIRRCLEESGLAVKDLIETPLRNEGNQPVIGYVVMAWKTSR